MFIAICEVAICEVMVLKNPFRFGMVVKGEDFCDRHKEMKEISQAIKAGMSVSVISPRRYGKTSMIVNLLDTLEDYTKVYMDLMTVTSLNDFLERYSSSIFNSLGGIRKFLNDMDKLMKVHANVELNLGNFKFNFEASPNSTRDIEEVIGLPEKFKEKFVIVMDEFQEILNVTNIDLIAILRKKFQFFNNVSFIFSGSKRTMMKEIFSNPQKPFYRFSQIYELKPLERNEVVEFILKKFAKTGLKMERKMAERIYEISCGHAYYVQALCYHLWFMAREAGNIEESQLDEALKKVLLSEKSAFESVWDELNPNQKKVLKVLSYGKSPYSLKMSAGSVKRALETLEKSDIVEKRERYEIIDPILRIWLREEI